MTFDYDVAIIGAGAVGLAVGRKLVAHYPSLVVLERHEHFGEETSSRNSEVIHGGIYYPRGSLKAELCTRGRELLYDLCKQADIPHQKTGKIIVATDSDEEQRVHELFHQAQQNGVPGMRLLSSKEVKELEPAVSCTLGLLSPETGIIDAHSLMRHCASTIKEQGGDLAYGTELIGAERLTEGYKLTVHDHEDETYDFTTRFVINAAGLDCDTVASLFDIDVEKCGYELHYAKGNYFRYSGPSLGINKLIYPVPGPASLGIHLVLDLAGQYRFGPDIQFLNNRKQNYNVDNLRLDDFYIAIHKYLPQIDKEQLHAGFSGIRPKLTVKGEKARDFVINHEEGMGLPGLVNLIGIESPGLTSCLAIAERVAELLIPA